MNLKDLDSIVGEQVFEEKGVLSSSEKENLETSEIDLDNPDYKDLTKEHKEAIDEWLKKNGYNRYGDSAGVIYTGGTPLFDEVSTRTEDRFEYILKRHPTILKEVSKN